MCASGCRLKTPNTHIYINTSIYTHRVCWLVMLAKEANGRRAPWFGISFARPVFFLPSPFCFSDCGRSKAKQTEGEHTDKIPGMTWRRCADCLSGVRVTVRKRAHAAAAAPQHTAATAARFALEAAVDQNHINSAHTHRVYIVPSIDCIQHSYTSRSNPFGRSHALTGRRCASATHETSSSIPLALPVLTSVQLKSIY